MGQIQRVLVGICTFNESGNVESMLRRIHDAMPAADIVVVDDSSPDDTASIARSVNTAGPGRIDVIERVGQRGLGGAIRVAMNHAIDNRYDLFVNLDADLSHDPADIPRLIAAMADRFDVAVGSRYVPGGRIVGWPRHRRWMSGLLNGFTRRWLRLPVADASGSFRCYRVSTLASVFESPGWVPADASDGYAFLQEVLQQLHAAGATFAEVPITFTDRIAGSSKLDTREAIRSVATILRLTRR